MRRNLGSKVFFLCLVFFVACKYLGLQFDASSNSSIYHRLTPATAIKFNNNNNNSSSSSNSKTVLLPVKKKAEIMITHPIQQQQRPTHSSSNTGSTNTNKASSLQLLLLSKPAVDGTPPPPPAVAAINKFNKFNNNNNNINKNKNNLNHKTALFLLLANTTTTKAEIKQQHGIQQSTTPTTTTKASTPPPPPPSPLADVLAKVADPVFVVYGNRGYRQILANFLCNMQLFPPMHSHILVIVTDEGSAVFLRSLSKQINVFVSEQGDLHEAHDFESPGYLKLMLARGLLLVELLAIAQTQSKTVIWLEPDFHYTQNLLSRSEMTETGFLQRP